MLPSRTPAQILSIFGQDSAFLQSDGVLYWSRGEQPVARLIQAVYDARPELARRILRARIYSNAVPTEMELGMVKVAAKRLSAPIAPEPPDSGAPTGDLPLSSAREIHPEPPPPLLDPAGFPREILELLEKREFMRAACALSERIPKKARAYESDRRVAALLVGPDQRLLAASVNSNAKNRTRHAEVNLVQARGGLAARENRALPRGSSLYVTLKCCKMCAAMIWCAAEDVSQLRVLYAEDDPGPGARSTVLTPLSFERKRASRSSHELRLEIEHHQPV